MKAVGWSEIAQRSLLYSQCPDGWYPSLADWVECQALLYPAIGCDRTTLESTLCTSGWEPPYEDTSVSYASAAAEAFNILASRYKDYGGNGYPFILSTSGPTLKFDAQGASSHPYIFLLGLSYSHPNLKSRKSGGRTGAYLLEALAWLGMQRLLGSPDTSLSSAAVSHHLGSPSLSKLPGRFDKKINQIILDINEGGSYKPLRSGHIQKSGENGVDLLFRRGFRDSKGAQFLMLGACSAGKDWSTTKRYECNPADWLDRNFTGEFLGTNGTARFFAIPRDLPVDGWETTARAGGMIIDRCRLSYITHLSKAATLQDAEDWVKTNIA